MVLFVISFFAVVTSFFTLAVASLALSGVLSIKKGNNQLGKKNKTN